MTALFIGSIVPLVFGYSPLTCLGLGLTAYSLHWLISSLGKDVCVLQIALLTACLQWVLGPFIAYEFVEVQGRYGMRTEQTEYMRFAVPGTAAFAMGLRMFRPNTDLHSIEHHISRRRGDYHTAIWIILFIGVIATMTAPYIPVNLRFIFFLLSQLTFISIIYLFITKHRFRWSTIIIILGLSLFSSINNSMFGTFFLWSALIFSFVARELNLSTKMKYAVFMLAVLAMGTVQSVKTEYRHQVWYGGYQGSRTALFVDYLISGPAERELYSAYRRSSAIEDTIVRLNQGWIISAVLSHVPRQHPFEQGRTISNAVQDSLVPRFLVSKREVAASDNFRKYTGLQLAGSTSMGISVLGEAWVNFGNYGVIFMFAWGVLLSGCLMLTSKFAKFWPTMILWAPLVFLQSLKAETELVVALNHLTKALPLVVALLWGLRYPLRLRV